MWLDIIIIKSIQKIFDGVWTRNVCITCSPFTTLSLSLSLSHPLWWCIIFISPLKQLLAIDCVSSTYWISNESLFNNNKIIRLDRVISYMMLYYGQCCHLWWNWKHLRSVKCKWNTFMNRLDVNSKNVRCLILTLFSFERKKCTWVQECCFTSIDWNRFNEQMRVTVVLTEFISLLPMMSVFLFEMWNGYINIRIIWNQKFQISPSEMLKPIHFSNGNSFPISICSVLVCKNNTEERTIDQIEM